MAVLSITIGTLDKAAANEIYKLAKPAAVHLKAEEDRYSRQCMAGGKEGVPDPHHGDPVYIVRITAEKATIGRILRTYSEHLGTEWEREAQTAQHGRLWFAT